MITPSALPMKKISLLLTAFLALAMFAAPDEAISPSTQDRPSTHQDSTYTYGQCQAIAKSTGKRCKRGVSNPGDIYCWQHKQ
jgi:hypothetical protein